MIMGRTSDKGGSSFWTPGDGVTSSFLQIDSFRLVQID